MNLYIFTADESRLLVVATSHKKAIQLIRRLTYVVNWKLDFMINADFEQVVNIDKDINIKERVRK